MDYDENDFYYNFNDGPYLIWGENPVDSVNILWFSNYESETVLHYGASIYNLTILKFPEKTHFHRVELSGLETNRTYYFRIPNFHEKFYNFSTSPEGTFNFNFTVLGDTQNNGGLTSTEYPKVLSTMDQYQYDFVVHTGDTCFSGSDFNSWHIFFDSMENQRNLHPFLVSIGNHEYLNDPSASYFRTFFPYDYLSSRGSFYSYSYSNAHFIILDSFDKSYNPLGFEEKISSEQVDWLEQELSENSEKWLFVILHTPPLCTGSFNYNEALINQLLPLFEQYRVDIVFSGHCHQYEAFFLDENTSWGGTYYFVTGGGGGDLSYHIMNRETNPWKHIYHNASKEPYQYDDYTLNNQIYGELCHHFLQVEVKNKTLNLQVIRSNKSIIQEFMIKKL